MDATARCSLGLCSGVETEGTWNTIEGPTHEPMLICKISKLSDDGKQVSKSEQLANVGIPTAPSPTLARLSEVNTQNDVLLATGIRSQNHLDAPRRLWRSFTGWNSPNPFL
jgi:hypothetical protein